MISTLVDDTHAVEHSDGMEVEMSDTALLTFGLLIHPFAKSDKLCACGSLPIENGR